MRAISDLDDKYANIHSLYKLNRAEESTPDTLVKDFSVEIKHCDGEWETVKQIRDNYQRVNWQEINQKTEAVKLTILATHGKPVAKIYSIDFQ